MYALHGICHVFVLHTESTVFAMTHICPLLAKPPVISGMYMNVCVCVCVSVCFICVHVHHYDDPV